MQINYCLYFLNKKVLSVSGLVANATVGFFYLHDKQGMLVGYFAGNFDNIFSSYSHVHFNT